MKVPTLLVIAALGAVVTAGCTIDTQQESTTGASERSVSVNVPSGATELKVDTTANAQSGVPAVTVLVRDDSGNILGSHTFAVHGTQSDQLTVGLHGESHVTVIAKVVDGSATLDVRVTAVVPGQPDVIVVRQTIVITQTTVVNATTSTTSTPSTTTTTTTTAPTPTPTTPANNSTNTTP